MQPSHKWRIGDRLFNTQNSWILCFWARSEIADLFVLLLAYSCSFRNLYWFQCLNFSRWWVQSCVICRRWVVRNPFMIYLRRGIPEGVQWLYSWWQRFLSLMSVIPCCFCWFYSTADTARMDVSSYWLHLQEAPDDITWIYDLYCRVEGLRSVQYNSNLPCNLITEITFFTWEGSVWILGENYNTESFFTLLNKILWFL